MKLIQKGLKQVNLTPYILLDSFTITLIDLLFLSGYISKFKTNGVKVQELFNCHVYNMEWNETNSGDKPNGGFTTSFELIERFV